MTLSQKEYDVLNQIARNTRMDCWFWISQYKDGTDNVHDL